MTRNADGSEKPTDLPIIGAVVARKLEDAGVKTVSDLKNAGSIGALLWVRARAENDPPCASMLCALEGAIRGIRRHEIPKRERTGLWRRYQARLDA